MRHTSKAKPRNVNLLKVGQNHIFFLEKLKISESGVGRVTLDRAEAELPSGHRLVALERTPPRLWAFQNSALHKVLAFL